MATNRHTARRMAKRGVLVGERSPEPTKKRERKQKKKTTRLRECEQCGSECDGGPYAEVPVVWEGLKLVAFVSLFEPGPDGDILRADLCHRCVWEAVDLGRGEALLRGHMKRQHPEFVEESRHE